MDALVLGCIALALVTAIAAATFVFGRQIGRVERDNAVAADRIAELAAALQELEQEHKQLEIQYEQLQRDRGDSRRRGGWDPGDLERR